MDIDEIVQDSSIATRDNVAGEIEDNGDNAMDVDEPLNRTPAKSTPKTPKTPKRSSQQTTPNRRSRRSQPDSLPERPPIPFSKFMGMVDNMYGRPPTSQSNLPSTAAVAGVDERNANDIEASQFGQLLSFASRLNGSW